MARFTIECGKSIQFEITDDMILQLGNHQNAFDHVLMIGLKNLVQDSHASCKREDFETEDEWKAESRRIAEMKLGSILSGDAFIEALVAKNADRFAAEIEAAWTAELAERAKAKEIADSVDLDI